MSRQVSRGGTANSIVKAVVDSRSSGKLCLSGKELNEVPKEVYDYDYATSDAKWWEINPLCHVDLSHCTLRTLPEELGVLGTITHLDVSNNGLQGLFNSITNLETLKLLNFEGNKIQACPDTITQLPRLVVLQCGGNRLRHLPERLGYWQPILAAVACQKNMLEELPQGFACCNSLTKLDASNNRLAQLNPQLLKPGGMVDSITDLDLSGNQLSTLPYEAGMLRRLRTLSLRENRISELPPTIGGCTALVELHLGYNALTSLPDEVAGCQQLKTLDVRNNRIMELGPGLCRLKLSLLDLRNNDLRNLPAELCHMTTLRSLPLEGNPLKLIRHGVVQGPISGLLSYLESRLPVEGGGPQRPARGGIVAEQAAQSVRPGNLFGVDESTLAADAARKIALGGAAAQQAAAYNAADAAATPGSGASRGATAAAQSRGGARGESSLAPSRGAGPPSHGAFEPPSRASMAAPGCSGEAAAGYVLPQFGKGGAAGGGGGGQELSLKGAGLQQLPPEVWHAGPFVGKLDLSGNNLANLAPGALGVFNRAFSIVLSKAGLTQWPLPWQPGCMPDLQDLIVPHNRDLVVMPPPALAAFPGLFLLDMSGTPAGAALLRPGAILPAASLTHLDLSSTGLAGFPPDIARLPKLRMVNLANNKIVAVPDEIGHGCTRLEELDLSNNALSAVSPYLGKLPVLRSLKLEGNPLRTLRRTILDRGTPAVLEFLRSRIP